MVKNIFCIFLIMAGYLFAYPMISSASGNNPAISNSADRFHAGDELGGTEALMAPLIILPRYVGDTTKGIYVINLSDGAMYLIDDVQDSPEKLQMWRMKLNIFDALGWESGNPAKIGEIVAREMRKENGDVKALVAIDTTTGVMAFITDLSGDPDKGKIQQVGGKPAQEYISTDGNFIMPMHYTRTGETDGGYLCHLTKGKCLHFNELHKMHKKYSPDTVDKVCMLPNKVSMCEIHTGLTGARFHLLIDHATREMYWIEVSLKDPEKLFCREENIKLRKIFPEQTEVATVSRYVVFPILIDNDSTWEALIVDGGTGNLAYFNVHDYKKWDLKKTSRNIYQYLEKDVSRPRMLTGITRISKGFTKGGWLFDSATGSILYIDKIDNHDDMKIHPVVLKEK